MRFDDRLLTNVEAGKLEKLFYKRKRHCLSNKANFYSIKYKNSYRIYHN